MDPTFRLSRILIVLGFALSPLETLAQTDSAAQGGTDLSWIREFASPDTPQAPPPENRLNFDPRFDALLKLSLHQHQSFWLDNGQFTPVAELVHEFIGVPGSVLLEENRYVTINGCVPHDCGDRGMVWIDTAAAGKPVLVFVATGAITNGPRDYESQIHLWLFSSTKLNWQKLPPQFGSSLTRWWNKTTEIWTSDRIVLVTLVQPSGELVDLSPSLFGFNGRPSPAKN